MPYIEAKLSCTLTQDKISSLKSEFGKAIECIPGKSEAWLMVNIEDGKNLYFKGDNSEDAAFISVSVFGKASSDACENLTKSICKIINEITGISPDRTYVTYSEFDKWGWNNMNF